MITARQRQIRRLYDLLRASLLGGLYGSPGQGKLPTEAELMAEFRAPRDVVREALDALRTEGFVARRQGTGTLVTGDSIQFPTTLPPASSTFERHMHQGQVTGEVLDWTMIAAPSIVAARLDGVRVGDPCLAIDYVMKRDGRPMAAITNYVRSPELERLREEAFTTDFYTLLAASGVVLDKASLVLEASAAEPRVAQLLQVPVGTPVLWFEQIMYDPRGEGFDFATGTFHREVRASLVGIPTPE